jgi:antitoxin PrlF
MQLHYYRDVTCPEVTNMAILKSAEVVLRAESRLTARSQTTIPATIRDVLHLKAGENIEYRVLPDGAVMIARRQDTDDNDPVVARFLTFLAKDMGDHPERIKSFDKTRLTQALELTAGVNIDVDTLLAEDE